MLKHLLKKEYPTIKRSDYQKAVDFIAGKCSQYYFLDYMRTTNGNVDDAIELYLLDDRLRSLLTQYLIRFEIQLKTDFVDCVQASTRCTSFWSKRKYYLSEARNPGKNGKPSIFFKIKKHILSNISRMRFVSMGPSNYAMMYSSSFGTFQELFKLIDRPYKAPFIVRYTLNLSHNDFRTLNAFLEAIRRVRNRCAHGNHVVTLKMVNELNSLRQTLTRPMLFPGNRYHFTVMEAMLFFVTNELNCGNEFRSKLNALVTKHFPLLSKYPGKTSVTPLLVAKLS